MARLERFIGDLIRPSCPKRQLDPPATPQEEKLFFLALEGTELLPPIIRVGVEAVRPDAFVVTQGIGKGPYHLLEFPKDGSTGFAREYITQVAALACLYYIHKLPASHLRFEFNYRHSETQHWPMDIVLLERPFSQQLLLYAETKTHLSAVESLIRYLSNNPVPPLNCKDRGVKDGDNIRKAKYLWSTRVPFIWLVSPENVNDPTSHLYQLEYQPDRRINLLPAVGGVTEVRQRIEVEGEGGSKVVQ